MNLKEIQKLMDAFQRNGLTELELVDEKFNLKLKRELVLESPTVMSTPPVPREILSAEAPSVSVSGGEGREIEETMPENVEVIESPIIGTFYRAPNPDAEPYVSVGDVVRKGQVLCIIEAMKIMNEIESEVEGTIVKIFPKNAEAVEFGQKLFAVKPV